MDDRLNYQESCFIINAMNYYLASFKIHECNLFKESIEKYENIIKKYEKLENQILNLRIKEEKQCITN